MLGLEPFDLNLAVKREWEERAGDDADLYSMAHEVDRALLWNGEYQGGWRYCCTVFKIQNKDEFGKRGYHWVIGLLYYKLYINERCIENSGHITSDILPIFHPLSWPVSQEVYIRVCTELFTGLTWMRWGELWRSHEMTNWKPWFMLTWLTVDSLNSTTLCFVIWKWFPFNGVWGSTDLVPWGAQWKLQNDFYMTCVSFNASISLKLKIIDWS